MSARMNKSLVNSILDAQGGPIPVDRRPRLNDRLAHRIVAAGAGAEGLNSTMTEIVSIRARGNPR